tara:strand:- start:351 stop:983 length:633 start_codon:yes stop_codon:yes gene_type:complete
MKKWLHKIELAVDWLIPWLIVLLLFIIITELFFHDFAEQYHTLISVLDGFVIFVFVLDIIFKWIRIRNIKKFFKTCWLDILAVFPFFLFFRFLEQFIIIIDLSKDFKQFQLLFHEGLELEKTGAKLIEEGSKLIQEAEKAGKVSRVKKIVRFFKPIARSPRLIKALPFYEKPTGKHHIHDPEREFEEAFELLEKEEKKVEKIFKKKKRKL